MKKTIQNGFGIATKKTRSKPQRAFGSVCRGLLMAGILSAPALPFLLPSQAHAQNGPVKRTVDGVVQDSNGANVRGAVVYLKDTKTLSVKSFVSTDAGTFHFSQLSPDTDYDVWAEMQGKKSKTKSISQFNSKTQFTYTLKIEN